MPNRSEEDTVSEETVSQSSSAAVLKTLLEQEGNTSHSGEKADAQDTEEGTQDAAAAVDLSGAEEMCSPMSVSKNEGENLRDTSPRSSANKEGPNRDPPQECAVCLDVLKDVCKTSCNHYFCRDCIKRSILFPPPHSATVCPYCRAPTSLYTVKDVSSGLPLKSSDVNSIFGLTFIQAGEVGVASYHFDSLDDSYISYASCPPAWKLGDGSQPAARKPFTNTNYDAETRTFTGEIDWSPTTFGGDAQWQYTMVFDHGFNAIVQGHVVAIAPDGSSSSRSLFGKGLFYRRHRKTIFGSVFLQALSPFAVQAEKGVASYHFETPDHCYISYTRAPNAWHLDDGSRPPLEKPFENCSFDGVNVFRGTVHWRGPSFGGARRWEYEMIFAPNFECIAEGQLSVFKDDGDQPAEVLKFGEDIFYCIDYDIPKRG